MTRLTIAAVMLALLVPAGISALTAEEIIRRMEENTVYDTARSKGSMIINDRFGTKVSTYVSYAEGADTTLIEFTSLEEEGMKILRTQDEIYLFYPDAEELIRLQGAALRDSVMGSDMSYEDMTGGKDLLDAYKETHWMIHYDGVHANDLGHRIVANRIFEVLAQHCSCLAKKTKAAEKTSPRWRDESCLQMDFE